MNQARVLVFGTFDGLHAGHKFFLESAKSQGSYLVVGVARDKHVEILKEKKPIRIESLRLRDVSQLQSVDKTLLCDKQLGSYAILDQTSPDLIVLGHDQTELEQDLLRWMQKQDRHIPLIRMKKL